MAELTVSASAERARWQASAEAWERWADPIAPFAAKLNGPLIQAAGVGPGHLVLDLASGVGEPALNAARAAGPDGGVLGLDLTEAMLRTAARRARRPEFTGGAWATFAAADMCLLPLPDASFDALTCRFGIMFVPEVGSALAECRRVLRPGGRAAFMVWGPREANAQFAVLSSALDAVLGSDPADAVAPLFRFARPGSLETAMTAAGFSDVTASVLTPVARLPAGEPFWRATLEMTFATRIAGLPEAGRAVLETAIHDRFRAMGVDGTVALGVNVRIVSARA
ncbi:class I SAM-dependent methyltransferase [Arenibaculum pallidiluteum]|uniref:class I SAM-dependent methyltransferase n=1 Tax=Arenibaculum pallidiluteum TaxID=2812559 RepID=UPI001A96CEA1|nr:methyltransferase domain-containing protein [Arenibaculum pallidiluteum]